MSVGRLDWEDQGILQPLVDIPRRGPLMLSVSGLMGSGKTFVADDVAGILNGAGRQTFRMSFGDVCRLEWMAANDPDAAAGLKPWPSIPTPELQAIGEDLSGANGMGLVSKLLFLAEDRPDADIIFDGGRKVAELRALRDTGFRLVWVDAPTDVRLARLRARARRPEDVDPAVLNHRLEREAAYTATIADLFHVRIINSWRPE
jgi:hypothetical protein